MLWESAFLEEGNDMAAPPFQSALRLIGAALYIYRRTTVSKVTRFFKKTFKISPKILKNTGKVRIENSLNQLLTLYETKVKKSLIGLTQPAKADNLSEK